MSDTRLSNNDSSVLSALFDPEASLSRNADIDDKIPSRINTDELKLLQQSEREALRLINGETPLASEIEQSVARLTAIIESNRLYASAFNNRAQACRMLVKDEELASKPDIVRTIFDDISQAIELATPSNTMDPISPSNARVLASAHTHRGYLLLLASKSEANRQMLSHIPGLKVLSSEKLEEAASRDFAIGGRYGNDTARQLAVKTNPYAKLCGSIVKEALTKEISDFYQIQVELAR